MAATQTIAASSRTARIMLLLKLFLEFIATISVLHSHGLPRYLVCRLAPSLRGYRRAELASDSASVQCLCTAAQNAPQLGKTLGVRADCGRHEAAARQRGVNGRNQIPFHVRLHHISKRSLRQTGIDKFRAFMDRQEH